MKKPIKNPSLAEFHEDLRKFYGNAFDCTKQDPYIESAKLSEAHEKLFSNFVIWASNGSHLKMMPELPSRPLKDVIGDLATPAPIEDAFELDGMCFGLKLNYKAGRDDDGWYADEIYIDGSSHDIKDELEMHRPDVYKAICQAVADEMAERKNTV